MSEQSAEHQGDRDFSRGGVPLRTKVWLRTSNEGQNSPKKSKRCWVLFLSICCAVKDPSNVISMEQAFCHGT